MEILSSVWQIGLIALVAGVLIGVLAYRLISTSASKTEQIRTELDETKDELEAYKASVQSHFDKTSELVNELTQNYARVYQHLAEGAHKLGDSQALNNLLEQQPGKVVIAVEDEAAASDPLANEVAIAQARASVDVPLEEGVGAPQANLGAAAEPQPVGEPSPVSEPAIGDAEQFGWEPTSPGAAVDQDDSQRAEDQSAVESADEPSFETTQEFSADSGTVDVPVESEAAAPDIAVDETAAESAPQDSRRKGKEKETETA